MKSRQFAELTVALAVVVAGCAGPEGTPAGDTSSTFPPSSMSTTTSATTITPAPATTSSRPSTTTSTAPLQPEATADPTTTTIRLFQYAFPIRPADLATYGDTHHDYPATDIFAPAGTTVVAVTDGHVDELRREDLWDPDVDDPATRGGRYVSIIGDDGVRYYCSHLESVDPDLEGGRRIEAGQSIGTVGTSGNAAGTSPHCHFGISAPTYPGDWETRRGEIWPYPFLRAWQRGEAMTPELGG